MGKTVGIIATQRLEGRRRLGHAARAAAERLDEVPRAPRIGRGIAMEVISDGLERRILDGERDALAATLRLGFDPNSSREGDPLLFAAIDSGDVEMVELLLGHTAGVNARSRRGITALHHAMGRDDPAIALRLLEKGASPSLRAKGMDEVPLQLAAACGDPALLDAGAKPGARDEHGETPLHRAVRASDLAAVRLLRRVGADATAENEAGEKPLDLAPDGRYAELARALK